MDELSSVCMVHAARHGGGEVTSRAALLVIVQMIFTKSTVGPRRLAILAHFKGMSSHLD